MNILFDTHTFLSWTGDSGQLPGKLFDLLLDPENQTFLSVATSWEVQMKAGIGKLRLNAEWESIVDREIEYNALNIMPISLQHTYSLARLRPLHKDPFDRMLVAQCVSEDLVIATKDDLVRQYPNVKWIWE